MPTRVSARFVPFTTLALAAVANAMGIDLIYDTLRQHEPNHILLRATRQDAAWQLADLKRLGDLLKRAKGRIVYRRLDRISPLAVPVLLEIGKERVLDGTAEDELLDIAAQELIDEATRL